MIDPVSSLRPQGPGDPWGQLAQALFAARSNDDERDAINACREAVQAQVETLTAERDAARHQCTGEYERGVSVGTDVGIGYFEGALTEARATVARLTQEREDEHAALLVCRGARDLQQERARTFKAENLRLTQALQERQTTKQQEDLSRVEPLGAGDDATGSTASRSGEKPSLHTPGPWRWELNLKSREISLNGGKPRFDLTVLDVERWGMSSARIRLLDRWGDGMMVMAPCEKFAAQVPGREHHADWFQTLNHPDARLIAAAPELLDTLRDLCDAIPDETLAADPVLDAWMQRGLKAIQKATA